MRFVVILKQIPDDSIKKEYQDVDQLNDSDKNVIKEALDLRDRYGGTVDVIGFGPLSAEDVMKEKELNREERNKTVMETGALVMAEFYADWCPHCQKMMPIVKEFKELEKGKLEVVQINIEEESALADLYTVESIPTFILLRKGEALWRQSGEMNLDRLRKVVEDVVG